MNRLYRPRSFLSLLLTGFFFVALPLVIALVSSIQILDGLVQQSAVAVFRSVGRIDSCRKLTDLLHSQERSARLYAVLGEPDHLREVDDKHKEIVELLQQLMGISSEDDLHPLAEQLQAQEEQVVNALHQGEEDLSGNRHLTNESGPLVQQLRVQDGHLLDTLQENAEKTNARKAKLESALAGYSNLGEIAGKMERLSNELMAKEVDLLKEQVRANKTTLAWQISCLIGFSALLVVLFISLINKPVSQLDRGIERLGAGDFTTPIIVSGPRDLEVIGAKLDWLRKRLSTLDREKVRMLAHISHELKTPLSSIKEGAGLLKDGLLGELSSDQVEVVGILDKNCTKLQHLIQNILDFNMAQAKEMPHDFEEIRIDALAAEVAEDHRNAMFARNIQLVTEYLPVSVSGNRKQLRTVIDNLLANAVKFTPDNGQITLQMAKKNAMMHLTVKDTGPGISEEDRPHIFQPFFQGSPKNRSVVKGSGLGLAISKEYIQSCGGTLRLVPSEIGASFEVTMPYKQEGTE